MSKVRQPRLPLTEPEASVLDSHLLEETDAQQKLLLLLSRKERALVTHDLKALTECLASASPILDRLDELTRRRARLFTNLCRPRGLPDMGTRFSALIELAPESMQASLQRSLDGLKSALRAIETQNRRNHLLVKVGLDVQASMVRAIFGRDQGSVTYNRGAASSRMSADVPYLSTEV